MMRRVHYKCASCGKYFNHKDVAVDHIEPISTFKDWIVFIAKLFCPPENLQVLCSYPKKRAAEFGGVFSCHYLKTQKEKEERRAKLSNNGRRDQ